MIPYSVMPGCSVLIQGNRSAAELGQIRQQLPSGFVAILVLLHNAAGGPYLTPGSEDKWISVSFMHLRTD